MNQLTPLPSGNLPALPELVTAAGDHASIRFMGFFVGTIRNAHTRRAYGRAVTEFLSWCAEAGVPSIAVIQPSHVVTWIEMRSPCAKRHPDPPLGEGAGGYGPPPACRCAQRSP